jgi:hypothetical protein
MCGDTEVAKKLLSNHTISKLWPLMLLHVWQNFPDRNEIFLVLNFLLGQCKVCMSWCLRFNLYVAYNLVWSSISISSLCPDNNLYVMVEL